MFIKLAGFLFEERPNMIEAYKEMIVRIKDLPKSLPAGVDWYLNETAYEELHKYGEMFGVTLYAELRTFVSISITKKTEYLSPVLTLRWAGILSHVEIEASEPVFREQLSLSEIFLLTQFKIENLVDANNNPAKSTVSNRPLIEL